MMCDHSLVDVTASNFLTERAAPVQATDNRLARVRRPRACAALLAALVAGPAGAVDGIAFDYGSALHDDVDLIRVALQWQWDTRWLATGNSHLAGYWDVAIGHWSNDEPARTGSGLTNIGVTPVLRWQQTDRSAVAPYAELGIGAQLISETSVSPHRRFSTHFQFGSHLGVGIRFGPRHSLDLCYRFQHLSNANIEIPNDGIDFHEVRLGYWF